MLLDPVIQGTHHKCWTLRSLVSTDIQQRAIPWSQLLLRRSQLPSTLNLSTPARVSAAASLLIPVALAASTIPAAQGWSSLVLAVALALILLLNLPFLALLWRRDGIRLAAGGTGVILIDTNILIWWVNGDHHDLPNATLATIEDQDQTRLAWAI
jgi:hypothetical protein